MKAIKHFIITATLFGGLLGLLQSTALAEKAGVVRISDRNRPATRPAIRQTAYSPQADGYNYYQMQTPVQTHPVSHGGQHSAPIEYYPADTCQTCNTGCNTCQDDHIPIKILTFRDVFHFGDDLFHWRDDCEYDDGVKQTSKHAEWWQKQKDMFRARMAYHHKVMSSHYNKKSNNGVGNARCLTGLCSRHNAAPYTQTRVHNVCDKTVYKNSSVTYPDKLGRSYCGSCRGRGCHFCGGHGLIQKGCNGQGCPPHGDYMMTYPVNPNYADQRDSQIYAAQGYGAPMAVPLAPTVRHTYNYGWGIPSSRMTPLSQTR